jgi:hypothetical protein
MLPRTSRRIGLQEKIPIQLQSLHAAVFYPALDHELFCVNKPSALPRPVGKHHNHPTGRNAHPKSRRKWKSRTTIKKISIFSHFPADNTPRIKSSLKLLMGGRFSWTVNSLAQSENCFDAARPRFFRIRMAVIACLFCDNERIQRGSRTVVARGRDIPFLCNIACYLYIVLSVLKNAYQDPVFRF